MSRDEHEIARLRAAIKRAETQERELLAAEAELEHAGRRINDQLERLGGRDPKSERKRFELREIIAFNTKERRQVHSHLQDLRRALAETAKSSGRFATSSK